MKLCFKFWVCDQLNLWWMEKYMCIEMCVLSCELWTMQLHNGVQIPNRENESCYLDMNASQKKNLESTKNSLII